MSKGNKTGKVSAWLVIGVIVLILLLFGWQYCATAAGDTDVSGDANFAQDNEELPANLQNDNDNAAAVPDALPATDVEVTAVTE